MISRLLSLLLIIMALQACDVHQWPEPIIDEPAPDTDMTTVRLRLVYEPDMYLWEHHYDPLTGRVEEDDPTLDANPDHPGTSQRYSNVQPSGVQIVNVKAYRNGRLAANASFARDIDGISYDHDIDIELPSGGTFEVVVWTHLLADPADNPFYDPADFNRVAIINDNYIGNTDFRDGFRGRTTVTTSANEEVNDEARRDADEATVVTLRRPMGKFEILTTDLSEFLDRETARRGIARRARADEYRVIISFPMYYPSSYSAFDDRLENSVGGMRFTTSMTVTGESEASLGFDYVFINNIADAGVQARISVFYLDGTQVASSSTISIPLRRDHHTLLRGAFLSMDSGGGVGIDPSYNGDHNILGW